MAIQQTIRVTADTSQAKLSLQELQAQLKTLAAVPVGVDATGLQSAKTAILELGQNLRAAMNPNTGKLDLSVFSRTLRDSNKTILDYKNALFSMGAQGQQAFLSLANTIAAAEAPTNRLNQKVLQFGKTLKNTINWQISSSLVHGVVGQVQKAINYAEKLNQSLNNIQIVTGKNNDSMAEFARQANRTAKQLSTTTTEYTNAALIYYQQGLSDKEVAARNETTLKLANVTRQTAQSVSDQMTAIWNNYAEGSENLEHYADVITALGAATAASSAEIAGGLEKFAAVSKTVGLSYNYATTALATIVATTRQSEDTVGTGLRTIFSRLESLKLGETLEDGVGLTKYSAALKTAGVEVLDQYGAVKDMDKILDELGAKWQTISREQQIALAQTVGGVRQYTNLMALMNNWGKFQQNLKIAEGADGTLQTQAERYAGSWEAARKRVQTSAEGIYDSLIDDQAMIKVTNVFSGFLDVINGLVAGFGGLKGIIPIVGALLLNSFAKNMPQFLGDIGNNFRVLTDRAQKDMTGMQETLGSALIAVRDNTTDPVYRAQLQKTIDTNAMNRSLAMNRNKMSEQDQLAYQYKIAQREVENDALIMAAQRQQQIDTDYTNLLNKITLAGRTTAEKQALKDISTAYNLKTGQGIEGAAALLPETYKEQIEAALKADAEVQRLTRSFRGSKGALTSNQNDLTNALGRLTNAQNRINAFETGTGTWKPGKEDDIAKASQQYVLDQERIKTLRQKMGDLNVTKVEQQAYQKEISMLEKKWANNEVYQKLLTDQIDAQERVNELENNRVRYTEKAETTESELADRSAQVAEEAVLQTKNTALNNLFAQAPQEQQNKVSANLLAELQGKAITTDNVKNLRQNGILTSLDQEAIRIAQEAYTSPLRNLGTKKGAYTAAQNKVEAFQKEFNDMFTVDKNGQKTIDQEAYARKANEFITNWNEAIKQSGLDDSMRLQPEDLLPKDDDLETAINNTVNKIKTATQAQAGENSQLAINETTIRSLMKQGGYTQEQMDAIFNNGQSNGLIGFFNNFNPKPSEKPEDAKPTQAISTSLTQVASAAMSLYSAFQSASNAVQSFSEDTATGLSKFGSVLSGITSTLMAGGMTGSALKNLGVSAGSAGWIGLAIAAVMAVIGGISGYQETIQKAWQKTQEDNMAKADTAIEQMNASGELISSQQNLINAYNQTADDLKRGQSSQKELEVARQALVQSLLETANGYSNSNATAAALSGNTTEVQRIIDQNRLHDLETKQLEIELGRASAENLLIRQQHNKGLIESDQYGIISFEQNNWKRFGGPTEEGQAQQILQENIGRFGSAMGSRTVFNKEALSTAQDIVEYYDTLLEIQSKMSIIGANSENSTTFRAITDQINAYAQGVANYKKYADVLDDSTIERLALGGTVNGQAIAIQSNKRIIHRANEIQTLEEYEAFRNQLIAYEKNIEQVQEGTLEYQSMLNRIDAYLGQVPAVLNHENGNLQYISKGIENVVNDQLKYNYNNELKPGQLAVLKANVQDLYKQYGDAIFDWNFTIPIPIEPIANADTILALQRQLDLIQAKAQSSKIKAVIEVTTNFDLDVTSSYADMAKFVHQMNDSLDINNPNGKGAWETYSPNHEKLNLTDFFALPAEQRAALVSQVNMAAQADYYSAGGGFDKELAAAQSLQSILGEIAAVATENYTSLTNPETGDNEGYHASDVVNNAGILTTYFDKDTQQTEKNNIIKTLLNSDITENQLLGQALQSGEDDEYIQSILNAKAAYEAATTAAANNAAQIGELTQQKEAYKASEFRIPLMAEADAWKINYDEIQQYATQLRDTGVFKATSIEESEKFALAVIKAANSLDTLRINYKEWLKILSDETTGDTPEKLAAYRELETSLKGILNLSKDVKLDKDLMRWAQEGDHLAKILQGDKQAFADLLSLHLQSKFGTAFDKAGDKAKELLNILNTITKLAASYKTGDIISDDDVNKAKELAKALGFKENTPEFNNAVGDLLNADYEEVATITIDADTSAGQAKIEALKAEAAASGQPITFTAVAENGLKIQDGDAASQTITITPSGSMTDGLGNVYTPSGAVNFTFSGNIPQIVADDSGAQQGGQFVSRTPDTTKKGGGGGGGKPKPHKQKRYRVIENKIQDNNRKQEETKRDKERAFGLSKIDLLKQERELEKENLQLEQQYLSEIDDWLGKDKQDLIDKMAKIGFTPEFDENGIMTNMDEFEAAWAALADGSKEEWTEAGEALNQYQETLAKYKDKLKEIKEIQQAIFDSLLEEVELKITLKLDVSNDRLEYIDYLLTKIDDDAYQAAEAIALLGEKTGETMAQAATYASGIEEILSHHKLPDGTTLSLENIGNMSTEDLLAANFTQDEIDKIREWRSSLLQANASLLEMRKTITDKLISAFEDLNKKVQRSYELFDHYNTTLEHYKNITDLIAKGNSSFQSRAALEALNRSSFTNSVNQLIAAKRILDDMPKYLAEAEQQYQDALASGDRNRIVQAERYLQAIQDREQEAREQWEEAWESSLESAQSFFEFTMENIAKDYEDTMSGMFGTLDYLQQAYERHKEDAEWYLESYDSLYQLGKLSRDISRAIDDTDSIRIKQRYRDLQAEINKLQKENAELTQHDIDMLQREFDLEVARAALEDAKNAKTQVRLQRDSEGNWGYVYTADEDKVNDALDKYAEALHAFQQANHEYFAKIQDDFMSLLDVGTQITDIMSDLDLTPEEALANIEDLMKSVLGDDGRLQRLLDDLKQANADEEKIRKLFTEIYGEDAVNNWLTFDDTLLKDLLNVDNIKDLRNLLTEAYEAAIKAGKEAREQLTTDVGHVGDAAGVSVEDFGEHVHGLVQHLDAESLAAIQSVDDLATAMNTTFTQAMQQALQWEKDYADQMANVIAQNEAFVTSINKMIEALSGINGIEFYTRVNGVSGSAGQAKFESFDSGGYTGIWGTNGRLAVLHEKEQIFNQDDTAKLLNAAQILRTLNLQANLASQGLGQLNLSSMFDHINSDFNQNVQITAEFPNATNHSEIEEAFTNLINKASQYANRKGI